MRCQAKTCQAPKRIKPAPIQQIRVRSSFTQSAILNLDIKKAPATAGALSFNNEFTHEGGRMQIHQLPNRGPVSDLSPYSARPRSRLTSHRWKTLPPKQGREGVPATGHPIPFADHRPQRELLLAAGRHQPLQPHIQRQRRILLIVMRHVPPEQPHPRPLRLAYIEHLRQIRVRQPGIRLVALRVRSLQRRDNGGLIRSLRRHLRKGIQSRVVRRAATPQLRLADMVHHPRKRPNLRRRLELIIPLPHPIRRTPDVHLERRIASLHLCCRSTWLCGRRRLPHPHTTRHQPHHRTTQTHPPQPLRLAHPHQPTCPPLPPQAPNRSNQHTAAATASPLLAAKERMPPVHLALGLADPTPSSAAHPHIPDTNTRPDDQQPSPLRQTPPTSPPPVSSLQTSADPLLLPRYE